MSNVPVDLNATPHAATLQLTLLDAIRDELRAALRFGPTPADEHELMLWYHMGWVDCGERPAVNGKAVRPLLTLLTSMATGGDWRQALPFAAAVELVHSFSLVHDDIQDRGRQRRGRPSVWAKWGESQAINVGDSLFASAHAAALRESGLAPEARVRAVGTLIDACLALSRGQFLDLSFEARAEVEVEEYMAMVRGKTAALLAAACELGGVASGASRPDLRALASFGEHLGVAFQIRDDLLGIWGDPRDTGKPATDIVDRKKTLPVLLGMERSAEVRALVERSSPEEAALVAGLLRDVGALNDSRAEMERNAMLALDALGGVAREGIAKDALTGLVMKAVDVTSLSVNWQSAAAA